MMATITKASDLISVFGNELGKEASSVVAKEKSTRRT